MFKFTKESKKNSIKSMGEINPKSEYPNTLPHKLRSKLGSLIPNYPQPKNPIGVLLHRKDIPQILRRLRHKIKCRKSNIYFMPRNMSRRKFNTTHYNKSEKIIK